MYAKLLAASVALGLRYRFDAVHAGRVLPEGLVAWFVARLTGRPLLIYAHGEELTTWRQPMKMRAMLWTYRHADLIIANSEFTRDELVKRGVPPRKIVLLYPGVDVQRFRPGLPYEELRAGICVLDGEKLIVSVGCMLLLLQGLSKFVNDLIILFHLFSAMAKLNKLIK